jgi:hypothetical protein
MAGVAAGGPAADGVVSGLGQALAAEYEAVHGASAARDAGLDATSSEADYRAAVLKTPQSALCLSGGGIRSAAFSLGVLQALAEAGLLARFDYLSTVSGGGFVGSWLQALIRQQKGDVAAATARLLEADPVNVNGAMKAPVDRLRGFTNYLTPQPGPLSEDSWADIVLYLRNLMINWFGLGTIFTLAVLGAIFYRTLLWSVGQFDWLPLPILLLAGVFLVAGAWAACSQLPSHRPIRSAGVDYLPDARVKRRIVYPLLAWAAVTPLATVRWLGGDPENSVPGIWILPALYFAAMMLGYWGAAVSTGNVKLYRANGLGWLAATLASAGFVWLGLHLSGYVTGDDNEAEALAVLAPLWLILSNVLQSTVHVALRREAELGDLDREWLARLSALKLRWAVLWALFAFCALSLRRLAFHTEGTEWPYWAVPVITFASGPTAAWLGKRAGAVTSDLLKRVTGSGDLPSWLLPGMALVFGVGLFTLLGEIVSNLLGLVQRTVPGPAGGSPWLPPSLRPGDGLAENSLFLLAVQAGVGAVLLALIIYIGRTVDVNRFSMHGVYRNRLTRAFLGAARDRRRPDPFTGFDPDDNLRMADLATATGPRKLFPVINLTLNLTASTRAAWAERKAASFTVTPLACGAATLARPGMNKADPLGCYVRTADYAGQEHEGLRDQQANRPLGMTLASAMTISGAAVSPNWGYHSSPGTAFLMTLFNLRLGAWLPNPARVTDRAVLRRARPERAFLPMLGDLLGDTTDESSAIYLSDGGHFDNLGLYEMVRRRCRQIVVVDAGQDFRCDFEDLGASIRKIAIDQQIEIDFDPPARIRMRAADAADALDFAMATIRYPEPGEDGRLLYVKPCYLGDIPADVRAYGATHHDFPHETTLDQWFTESQFESYRHLGEHQMRKLAKAAGANASIATLFEAAASRAGPAPDGPIPSHPPSRGRDDEIRSA